MWKQHLALALSMQITARQRYFTRLAVWALPISVGLGAVFGHFYTPTDVIRGYIHGAVTGILISSTIIFLEFVVSSRMLSALVRRVPFVVFLALRLLGYLVAILSGLAVSTWLFRISADGEPLIERGGVLFSFLLSLGFNLLYGVNRLLGEGVLLSFVAGRYRRPHIEERVLLFIDMVSSTAIAERLGEIGFLDFLNRFVADVTGSIVEQLGTIHKYVGDEIIVSWPLAAGLRDARCVRTCFDALARLNALADAYIHDFGCRADFRAALHCGPVVIGELGVAKMEIALLGDTMNTAERILQACRETDHRVLASAALADRLSTLPPAVAKLLIGPLRLRGKESEIALYALVAAARCNPSPTSPPFSLLGASAAGAPVSTG